jgi:hypothetical protein
MLARIIVFSLLAVVSVLPAQIRPDAPIQNFRFPVFGENGYKIWELRGVEGRYISDEESLILGMDLKIFSGDESMLLENRIRSPQAHIDLAQTTAEGASTLFVNGTSYEIEGSNWKWYGKDKRMTVLDGARVIFFDSFNILR